MLEQEQGAPVGYTTCYGSRVSTVWLGLDHNFFGSPPLIFESMAFESNSRPFDQDRYPTERAAVRGHYRMVARHFGPHYLAAVLSMLAVVLVLVVIA